MNPGKVFREQHRGRHDDSRTLLPHWLTSSQCDVKGLLVWPKKNKVKQGKWPPSMGRWLNSTPDQTTAKFLADGKSSYINYSFRSSEKRSPI